MRSMSHLYWSLWHLVLSYLIPSSYSNSLGCRLSNGNISGTLEPGDILIGLVHPFHIDKVQRKLLFTEPPPEDNCTVFLFESYQQFQAVRFALEEINNNPNLLPNITLGYHAYDSCSDLYRELEGTLWMLTDENRVIPNYCCREKTSLAAVIGYTLSTYAILMAHILGVYRYPQISHFSTSSILSDRIQFPSFFRTVPSDIFQTKGLAQLVLHFGWKWVGLVAMGNDYGQQGIQSIKQEILNAGGCVAFTEFIMLNRENRNAPYIVKVIRESTAKVIIAFTTAINLIPLLDEMLVQNVTGKIFVASEAWSISTILLVEKYSEIVTGSIGFAFHSSVIPGFKKYLNHIQPFNGPGITWTKIFWEKAFKCKFLKQRNITGLWDESSKLCTGHEDLSSIENNYNDDTNLRDSFNIYTSIHVIAKALHDLHMCQGGRGPFHNASCTNIHNYKPWQLLYYIQNVHVKLSNGREVFFDKNGDLPAVYDIVNWQKSANGLKKHVNVGKYDTTAAEDIFMINKSAVMWASGTDQVPLSVCSKSCPPGLRRVVKRGEPVCCFYCVPCSQGEISNETDSIDCLECPWDKWPNLQKDKCLPKTIEFLSYEDPMGATLAVTSVISTVIPVSILGLFMTYKSTPIVKANNYFLSCLLLVSMSLCFLCSLVFIGYPQPKKCLLRQAAFGVAFSLCISCILAKTIMVILAFMATKPGNRLIKWTRPLVAYMIIFICSLLQVILCVFWMYFYPPFPQYNTEVQPGIIIVECNENSPTAFWCMLGYLGLLASISFIVAFLARSLPDTFNEATFITFSMLTFLSVWISYIPASLNARGKYTVAMEVFAILSSSWALVVCMFAPKCFIILFRPKLNSKEHLMVKKRTRT